VRRENLPNLIASQGDGKVSLRWTDLAGSNGQELGGVVTYYGKPCAAHFEAARRPTNPLGGVIPESHVMEMRVLVDTPTIIMNIECR